MNTRGDWMSTYSGKQFWPRSPQPEDVDPLDIAHALSLICRFGGHINRFYSVAEHCVLMSRFVAPEHALWALLHDATEAYVGDMVRPLKYSFPEYIQAEDLVMETICTRFDIPPPPMPPEVKDADNRILLAEKNALLTPGPGVWYLETQGVRPLPVRINGWSPQVAEERYLDRLYELT